MGLLPRLTFGPLGHRALWGWSYPACSCPSWAGGSLYLDGRAFVGLPWFCHRQRQGLSRSGRGAGPIRSRRMLGSFSISVPGATWSLDLLLWMLAPLLSPHIVSLQDPCFCCPTGSNGAQFELPMVPTLAPPLLDFAFKLTRVQWL